MFGRRGGFGYGGNPILRVISMILSGVVVFILLYVFYELVILGGSAADSKLIVVLSNIFNWGIGVAKNFGDFVIRAVKSGGNTIDNIENISKVVF